MFAGCQDAAAVNSSVEIAATDPKEVKASVERGRIALRRFQCGACHAIPGVPSANAPWAPSLAHWGRRSYIAGHLPNIEANLAAWIRQPERWAPGTLMPDMGVSEATAHDMARYLLSLR